jgi:type II secretory pathway predicted ATPase ExeA
MKGTRDAWPNDSFRGSRASTGGLAVESRRDALETLRRALTTRKAPTLLLTGETGAGKTWLWKRLIREIPPSWRTLAVELSATLDVVDLFNLIGQGMGITIPNRAGAARGALLSALRVEAADGRSWILVLENAQTASDEVWSELQALIQAMETSEGFSALVLVGPTELARLLDSRRVSAVTARLSAHVHLLPLDLDEASELLRTHDGLSIPDLSTLEALHRDAGGNPRRLLQLAGKVHGAPSGPERPVQFPEPVKQIPVTVEPQLGEPAALQSQSPAVEAGPAPSPEAPPASSQPPASTPLFPGRPPLREEEGLIEVGWNGSLESESTGLASTDAVVLESPDPREGDDLPSEEMIEDHYAALQAWTEWARNRGRAPEPMADVLEDGSTSLEGGVEPRLAEGGGGHVHDPVHRPLPASVRAEAQHEHAPYSQLFSRLRQSR